MRSELQVYETSHHSGTLFLPYSKVFQGRAVLHRHLSVEALAKAGRLAEMQCPPPAMTCGF